MIASLYSCQSEAIFGSSARQECDHLSDRDYLIVDDDYLLRHRRRSLLKKMGWSVASYSWSRLERLVQKKALFAQHLKLEALVVWDGEDRLKHLLCGYSPASNYSADIDNCGAAITGVLESRLPNGMEGWTFDVLAVNIRNLAILALADQGEYEFSYERAIDRLVTTHKLSKDDARNLLMLRQYKVQYRQGRSVAQISLDVGQRLVSSVHRCVERVHCAFSQVYDLFDFLNYPEMCDLYLKSRLIERDILRSAPSSVADVEEWRVLTMNLLRKSQRPREYLWKFADDYETNEELQSFQKIAIPRDEGCLNGMLRWYDVALDGRIRAPISVLR